MTLSTDYEVEFILQILSFYLFFLLINFVNFCCMRHKLIQCNFVARNTVTSKYTSLQGEFLIECLKIIDTVRQLLLLLSCDMDGIFCSVPYKIDMFTIISLCFLNLKPKKMSSSLIYELEYRSNSSTQKK